MPVWPHVNGYLSPVKKFFSVRLNWFLILSNNVRYNYPKLLLGFLIRALKSTVKFSVRASFLDILIGVKKCKISGLHVKKHIAVLLRRVRRRVIDQL